MGVKLGENSQAKQRGTMLGIGAMSHNPSVTNHLFGS
jgi:hypothetical protein